MNQLFASVAQASPRRSAVMPFAPSDRRGRLDWRLVGAIYLVAAATYLAHALLQAHKVPLFGDTDDAMRLVMVRDFLHGQNWYDMVQHRLNVPFGGSLQWSQLGDLAIGGLILLVHPFAGASTETIVAYLWPLLLLGVLVYLAAGLALRLAGPEAVLAGALLPVFAPVVMPEFSPGRLDHTNIQILLMLVLALAAIEALTRPRFAVLAGFAAATSVAIGIGGLPNVIAAIFVFGVMWALRPVHARAMAWFGLSFAAFTIAHLALAQPPSRWFTPMCDAISIVYAVAAIGVGAIFGGLAIAPLKTCSPGVRLLFGTALGAALVAALLVIFPQCQGGPYAAVGPWLTRNWLDNVTEARPLLASFAAIPLYTIGFAVPPVLALAVTFVRLWRGPATERGPWVIYGAFLLATVIVMVAEVRGARFAAVLAAPAGAWLIAAARTHYLGDGPARLKAAWAAALVACWLMFTGLFLTYAPALAMAPFHNGTSDSPGDPLAAKQACLMPKAYAALAAMPPQRVMAPIDMGSYILLNTPDSVVAAPYHRAQRGLLDAFHFFNRPIADARKILGARGVTLVVTCDAMPEMEGLPDAAPNSFVKLFARSALPAWLDEVSAPGAALKIYRVLPAPGAAAGR